MKKWLITALASVFIVGLIFVPVKDAISQAFSEAFVDTPKRSKENRYTIEDMQQQQAVVYEYVAQQKQILDFKRQAPPGYYWDEIDGEYKRHGN